MSNAARNPDPRPLPPGWAQQYDRNYDAWFYVNASATPPVTTWTHPANIAPPPGPPPGPPGYGGQPQYNNQYQQPYQQQQPYDNRGMSPGFGGGGAGGLLNKLMHKGGQGYGGGGYSPGPSYGGGYGGGGYGGGSYGGGYQQQPSYGGQVQPQKSGMSTGAKIALGAGGGLLGGLLLEDIIQDKEQDSYQDGFQNGEQDNNNDNNDYGGGGDYDGGDGGF